MNDQRVKTDNEVIAEFMGIQVYQDHAEMQAVPIDKLSIWMYADQTKRYETEWKYLMEVVEKINSLDKTGVCIYPKHCMINVDMVTQAGAIDHGDSCSLIEIVYTSVVAFIKWYQKQKSS